MAGWLGKITRRDLLAWGLVGAGTGAVGLALGHYVGVRRETFRKRVPAGETRFRPNVFLALETDGSCVIWVTKSEMGQGVHTALPMIVAEELDADWSRVRIEHPPANRNYGDQMTVTSSSVRTMWEPLRQAGATARHMLIEAASAVWAVRPVECYAESGFVVHRASGRRLGYGELSTRAAALEVPSQVELKDPADFRLIGRALHRLDTPDKVTGKAVFGLDVRVPGMLFAVVARRPDLGAQLSRHDGSAAREMAGVVDVVELESGVAVLADSVWTAQRGRDALLLEWDSSEASGLDDERIWDALRSRDDRKAAVARQEGGGGELGGEDRDVLAVDYEVPHLAHAAMEPANCTAWVEADRCRVWVPTQDPQGVQRVATELTGLPRADVHVYTTLLGGGFGRRVGKAEVREAVTLSQRVQKPVQVVWTREDDVRHDLYRPAAQHRMAARIGPKGRPLAWRHRVVSGSIAGKRSADGIDGLAVDGATQVPYRIDDLVVDWVSVDFAVPLGFWRSVGHSHTAFAIESFIDELAHRAGQDVADYRRSMLDPESRFRAVLDAAVERSGWANPLPSGRHRGLAVHGCFGSFVAQVMEVSIDADSRPTIHRCVCAVDCGRVVNPGIVRAQVEGGVVYGLSAALFGAISFAGGAVVQSNFHDYRILAFGEMPNVEVELLESSESPTGVGEIGVPPAAPALANAIFGATGVRRRRLPLLDTDGRLRGLS